jgi:hypothetical protein
MATRLHVAAAILALAAAARTQEPFGGGPPVKVYVIAGQSNMVGIGQVTGGGTRWGKEFLDPVVSVYPGPYDPNADYGALQPTAILALESFGGVEPTPYPGGGVQIVRDRVQVGESGLYEFRPGYGGSTYNVMRVDGHEVYRREPGGEPKHIPIELTGGRAAPFEIAYLNDQANGLGWLAQVDIPGTLATVV